MGVWSRIFLREVGRAERIDAEHFRPDYVQNESLVNTFPSRPLSEIALSIARGTQPQYEEGGEFPVLRTVNVQNGYISETRQEFVSADFWSKNPRGQVRQGDILITSTGVGTLGRVTYNPHNTPFFADGHITIVRDIRGHDPQYIAAFLQSKVGRALIERRYRGSSGQIEIYPQDIGSIPIPNLGETAESDIVRACQELQRQRALSEQLYLEAETLLLDALGLNALDTKFALYYKANFSEVAHAGRFDAEYFHTRYIGMLNAVKAVSHAPLRQYAMMSSGYAWKSDYFLEDGEPGEPFIRIRDCKPGTIDNAELSRLDAEYALGENVIKAQAGDLTIGMDGVNYFYGALLREACFVNQRVCRVALHADAPFSPEYTLLVINSRVGQSQLLREMTIAQTVGHITNETIRNLFIPLLSDELRDELSEMVKASIAAKDEAQNLLEHAKTRIEELIERGG